MKKNPFLIVFDRPSDRGNLGTMIRSANAFNVDGILIMATTGSISANDYKMRKPIMVIIGNEAKGMSKRLIEICDKIIKIPMEVNINSLNVSCAASIIMWEIYKKTSVSHREIIPETKSQTSYILELLGNFCLLVHSYRRTKNHRSLFLIKSVFSSRARKSFLDIFSPPKLSKCFVGTWQSIKAIPFLKRVSARLKKAALDALLFLENIDSPKKALPINTP